MTSRNRALGEEDKQAPKTTGEEGMERTMRTMRVTTRIATGLCAVMVVLAPAAANAAVSEGHSQTCDSQGNCLVGGAYTTVTPTRTVGECYGIAPGASEISVTCSTDSMSETAGGSDATVAEVRIISLDPIETLCWETRATFLTNGGAELVSTGCSVVVI